MSQWCRDQRWPETQHGLAETHIPISRDPSRNIQLSITYYVFCNFAKMTSLRCCRLHQIPVTNAILCLLRVFVSCWLHPHLILSIASPCFTCFILIPSSSIFVTGHRIDIFASVAETKSLPFAFWGTHFLSGFAHSATSWKMVKTEWLKLTVFRRYLAVFFVLADIFDAFITCDCLVSFQLEPINRATNGRWDILRSWCRRRLGHSTPATKGEIDDIARSQKTQKIHPVSATQLAPLGFDTESRPCPHRSTRSM